MEIQIKKAVKAGNSSAVILPRAWLNRDVRIELVRKTPEMILYDAINIAKRYVRLGDIIGIYLVGSYARSEEDENSDIDILIITKDIDREIIREGVYNILIMSSELLKQKLENDLFPVGQMLREAVPLLNSYYLGSIKVNVTNRNIGWYLKTTENKLGIIKRVIDKIKINNKKYIHDKITYTLVLRIRTLYIIRRLIENKDYSKRDFIKLINDISCGKKAYKRYLIVKNNDKVGKGITIVEAERLYEYLRKELVRVEDKINGKNNNYRK